MSDYIYKYNFKKTEKKQLDYKLKILKWCQKCKIIISFYGLNFLQPYCNLCHKKTYV